MQYIVVEFLIIILKMLVKCQIISFICRVKYFVFFLRHNRFCLNQG